MQLQVPPVEWGEGCKITPSEQVTLLPECLDDDIGEDNPVRIVDAFVEELDRLALGFGGADPAVTGRPGYHPGVLLKLYIHG